MKRLIKHLLRAFGLEVIRRRDAIAIPRPQAGPARTEGVGIDWRADAVEAFLSGPLGARQPEWQTLAQPSGGAVGGYDCDNPFFGLADAAVCWTMVRHYRPPVVVEVGSGWSTRVLRQALDASGGGRLIAIDPQPRTDVAAAADEHRACAVQEVPAAWFATLPPASLLFIDSSHRAGTGSDVNHLFLEVLPRLAPRTLVHIHDIYLPRDYPSSWNLARGFLYSEQYLLQALLCLSHGFDVLWPGAWAAQRHRAQLEALFGARALTRHCSFWLQRNDRPAHVPRDDGG